MLGLHVVVFWEEYVCFKCNFQKRKRVSAQRWHKYKIFTRPINMFKIALRTVGRLDVFALLYKFIYRLSFVNQFLLLKLFN